MRLDIRCDLKWLLTARRKFFFHRLAPGHILREEVLLLLASEGVLLVGGEGRLRIAERLYFLLTLEAWLKYLLVRGGLWSRAWLHPSVLPRSLI